jgi:hypothetical protein
VHRPSGRRTWTHPGEEEAAAAAAAEPEAPQRLADEEQLSPADPCVVRLTYAQRCRRAARAALRWAIYPSVYAVHCLPPLPPPPLLFATTRAAGSGGRQWSIHPCMHMPSAYRIRVQTCGWLCGWRSGGLGERASQRGLRRRRRPLAAAAAAHHWHAPCRAAAAGPGAAPQLPRGAGVCCHHYHRACHRHGLPPLPATTACHYSPMMR